jgi:predicted nucleotidyltransferase component of viral defense system
MAARRNLSRSGARVSMGVQGGTCLKKCFFETYRFSEDLDFTVTDHAQLEEGFLLQRFGELSAWLYDETGIELPADQMRFKLWNNDRGGRSGEGRFAYRGPIAPRGDLPRVKLDLTADEKLVLPPVTRAVAHAYSDIPEEGITARCYAFEEVFGEKIRALGQRSRPRDLYDVINLFRNGEFHAAASVLRDIVHQKCSFKNVAFPTFEALNPFHDELVAEWGNILGHQLPSLPPVDSFWDALREFFGWLAGTTAPVIVPAYPRAPGDEVLRAPAGAIQIPGRITPFIEVIRFAGTNRLCVELDYMNEQGQRGRRTIVPYTLRRTRSGDILLYAVRADNRQDRSYRIDHIYGVQVTSRAFTPRYAIELTPTGPIVAPAMPTGGTSMWPRSSRPRRAASSVPSTFTGVPCAARSSSERPMAQSCGLTRTARAGTAWGGSGSLFVRNTDGN